MNTWNEFVKQRRQVYPEILKDHQAGMGGTELSEKYGISRQRIYRILKIMGIPATHAKGKPKSLKQAKKRRLKRPKNNGTEGTNKFPESPGFTRA